MSYCSNQRSGEFAGTLLRCCESPGCSVLPSGSGTQILSLLSQILVLLEVWAGAKACWNIKSASVDTELTFDLITLNHGAPSTLHFSFHECACSLLSDTS